MPAAPEPTTEPVRVLVQGASASVVTSWMGGPRADLAYPRVVEATLRAAGVPALVRVSALPADRARRALRTWESEGLGWAPDVVVLHYGHADCVHLFLPRWLERHANNPHRRPGRVRDAYRRLLLRPVWKGLANLQMWSDGTLDATRQTRRHRRVAAEVREVIRHSRTACAPLVLVPTIHQPGAPWRRWFPGAGARMRTMNETLTALVRDIGDPDVRIFPLAELVDGLAVDGGEPSPDGGHFTPAVHQAVGQAMAEAILEWMGPQESTLD
jgi:lysophospholipase L1-like esterase